VCGARASEHAARVEDVDRLTPSSTFALAHPLDDASRLAAAEAVPDAVVEMQPQRGERSKWPWEASRTTSSRLWRARAGSMVAGCRVVRGDTDVG